MQEILILRSRSDLHAAKYCIDSNDDYDLQVAAFHIQQAIEKILKQIIKDSGTSYSKTHEINALLKKLPSDQKVLSENLLNELIDKEDTLSKWERVTRYDDPYLASRDKVIKLYNLAVSVYKAYILFAENSQTKFEIEDRHNTKDAGRATSVKCLSLFDSVDKDTNNK